MPGFDGTGPMGMGPMTGVGRGFCSPRGAGVVQGRYGFPRWTGYAYPHYGHGQFFPGAMPTPRMPREQEMEFLKGEAQAMRDELKEIETRIERLSAVKE